MNFTKEAEKLKSLYVECGLRSDRHEIMGLPDFQHDDCTVRISYLPPILAYEHEVLGVFISHERVVTFTTLYIVPDEEEPGYRKITPFFDPAIYEVLKDLIIDRDGHTTSVLFKRISEHILNASGLTVENCSSGLWLDYRRMRTVSPRHAYNDDVFPLTLRNVRIGQLSKKRLRVMFTSSEAERIIEALWKSKMTVVFTSDPSRARDIFALLKDEHIFL